MKKDKKYAFWGSGIAAGITLFAVSSHIFSNHLTRIAVDRKEPKAITKEREKILHSEQFSDISKKIESAASRLEGNNCEEAIIAAHDGVTLVGHWRHCNNAQRAIIAMHGWRSSWAQDFGVISDFWHDHGCCVLYAEQRGQGESGGEYMGFGLLERYDCQQWTEWVQQRTQGKLPLYLVGISMGAATVLMASALSLPKTVRGIVADCAYTSPEAIWKHVAENGLHIPYGLCRSVAKDICRKKICAGNKEDSCVDALAQCPVPVLFVHGTEDHFVPIEMTYENYKACTSPKRLFVVPGAEHGMSYFVDKKGYETELLEFWKKYD